MKALKAQTAPTLTGICTNVQIARLDYNVISAERKVFPAITKAAKALPSKDKKALRQRVLFAALYHSVGRYDKCDECYEILKELCPEAAEP